MTTAHTAATASVLPIWKTIKLGTSLKTADDFRRALGNGGHLIGRMVNVLDKLVFTVSEREMDVDLVVVSVKDLGFKDGAHRRDIMAKALKLGLELCPAEVGSQLRLQYPDQPEDEVLVIGMEPIIRMESPTAFVYSVERHFDGRWLGLYRGELVGGVYGDEYGWCDFRRVVFVRPRKQLSLVF